MPYGNRGDGGRGRGNGNARGTGGGFGGGFGGGRCRGVLGFWRGRMAAGMEPAGTQPDGPQDFESQGPASAWPARDDDTGRGLGRYGQGRPRRPRHLRRRDGSCLRDG